MLLSRDRILTTHVGSLIRPPAVLEFMRAKHAGQPVDEAAWQQCLKDSVAEVVRQQASLYGYFCKIQGYLAVKSAPQSCPSAAPLLIAFLFAQKYFIRGIAFTGSKE